MTGHHALLHPILSVSSLTRLIRDSLERQFPDVWVEAEISNLRVPSSGHVYFTLKDDQSQLRGVLFRTTAQRLRFALQEGMAVIARGRITLYEPRGEYQLVVEAVEPKGIGALQLAYEQLKARLAAEGLFDEARKRPLPAFPTTVGVVTSLAGAAIRDIVAVFRRRNPLTNVLIAPVPVQGDGAAELIAEAIASLSALPQVDVLIVGRGGGSWEDLWAFNEEVVVRAIVQSPVPVVSAVGHEIDVTLSDFAADYRAPTPSAAAEAVVPVLQEIVDRLGDATVRLRRVMHTALMMQRHRWERSIGVLRETRFRMQGLAQRVDDVSERLVHSFRERLMLLHRSGMAGHHALLTNSPQRRIQTALVLVPQLCRRLEQETRRILLHRKQVVMAQMGALDALSPLAILKRGYSIVRKVSDGRVVRRTSEVEQGEVLQAHLAEGQLVCVVHEVLR